MTALWQFQVVFGYFWWLLLFRAVENPRWLLTNPQARIAVFRLVAADG
jgi:hypothetical protein